VRARSKESFLKFKVCFNKASILISPNFSKPFYVEIDALDFVIRAILSHIGEEQKLHPVALYRLEKNFNCRNQVRHL